MPCQCAHMQRAQLIPQQSEIGIQVRRRASKLAARKLGLITPLVSQLRLTKLPNRGRVHRSIRAESKGFGSNDKQQSKSQQPKVSDFAHSSSTACAVLQASWLLICRFA